MTELQSVIRAARALRAGGEAFLIATVVRVHGSSYRRPGARLLIAGDRWITGSVSGGCLEGDIVRRGWWHTGSAPAALVTYDSTADDDDGGWGVGLGCNGVVDILLERFDPAVDEGRAAMELLLTLGEGKEPLALVTVFRSALAEIPAGSRLVVRANGATEVSSAAGTSAGARGRHLLAGEGRRCLEALPALGPGGRGGRAAETVTVGAGEATVEALVEIVQAPVSLFVCGGGRDAVPLVEMARQLGWEVTVYEPRPRWARAGRFAGGARLFGGSTATLAEAVTAAGRALAVVMSHDFQIDRDVLRVLAAARVSYVGVLGPRRRTEKLLAELVQAGASLSEDFYQRLFAPVGLAVGAETPEEIALAILAEGQAALAGETAGFLRDRVGPLHRREENRQGARPVGHAGAAQVSTRREAAE